MTVERIADMVVLAVAGEVDMRLWTEGGDLVCEVGDHGAIEDPLIGRHRPDPDYPGGAGLWLANQFCDLVQLRSAPETGTAIRVRVALPQVPALGLQ